MNSLEEACELSENDRGLTPDYKARIAALANCEEQGQPRALVRMPAKSVCFPPIANILPPRFDRRPMDVGFALCVARRMSLGLSSDLHPALAPILNTVLDAVIVMGQDGRITAWNSVAEQIFGWSEQEVVGQMLAAVVVPPQHRHAHEQGLQRLNEGGEVRVLNRRIEITALCKDGREIPVELSITRASGVHQDSFIGFLRDISERRNAEDRQDLLVNELRHRVKNILAVVQAIAHQTFQRAENVQDAYSAFTSRLQALSGAQDLLIAGNWRSAPLRAIIDAALSGCGGSDDRFRITGPDVEISATTAVSISLAVHELCTNAFKYGALSVEGGLVEVSWGVETVEGDQRHFFEWRESGGPTVCPPTHKGFGTSLIERGLARELGGEVQLTYAPAGLVCRFTAEAAIS